jgi:hypothetical protein
LAKLGILLFYHDQLDRPTFRVQIERFRGRRFFSGEFSQPERFYQFYAGHKGAPDSFEHGIQEVQGKIDILLFAEQALERSIGQGVAGYNHG